MRSPIRFHWIASTIVVAATLAAYHNTSSGPFIFDDALAITHNPSIRSLWPLSSVMVPPSECTVAGRPFANLTFALNYAWGGTAVHGYHAVNLGLHIGAALLLFGVVWRTLELSRAAVVPRVQSESSPVSNSFLIALAIAVVWAVHPLLTIAVTYISQRTEVLMGFFYLASLYTFIRGTQPSSRSVWFPLSVAACFLGIASKEGMVTAPVLILLYDRTFVATSFREIWNTRWKYYVSLASSWLLLGLLLAGLKDRAVGFGLGVTWWTYALTECQAVLHYVRLVLWPFPLVFDYGVSFIDGIARGWLYLAGLVLVVAGTITALWRWPRAGFLAAAFLLILAPTSSVVPIATQPIAENRVYLPSAAIIALVVIGLNRVIARKPAWTVMALSAAAMVWLAIQRNYYFADPLALSADTVAKRPHNPRAHAVLGEVLYERQRTDEAKKQFESAIQLKPGYYEAHNNLGTTLYRLGDAVGARRHFEEALRLQPDYAAAHNNLANILLHFGEVDQAGVHGEKALRLYADPNRIKPDLAETHNNLGNVRLYQGNAPAAQEQYQAALELKPDFLEARMNLGVALRLTGQLEPARVQLEQVLMAKPDFAAAQFNLGVLLEQMGRAEEAVRCFSQAVALNPNFPEAHLGLAGLLRRNGDFEGAKKQLERVIELRPSDAAARASLEQVLALLGRKVEPNATRP